MNATKTIATYDHFTRASAYIVPSPCVSICTMNAQTGWCDGCHRTLDEIAQWAELTNPEKRAVLVLVEQRAHAAQPVSTAGRLP
jgi:uncharacterized protein